MGNLFDFLLKLKHNFQLSKLSTNLVMCGIVGIVSSDDVNQQIYDSLLLLQHRGQDSTGIATMENTVFHIHKVCLLYTSPSPRD